MNILLVGSGGREHALSWQLAQSPGCAKLYAAPGNPGIEAHAECVAIAVDDLDELIAFVKAHAIDFVVVGPEAPLVAGLADRLREIGIPAFGPSAAAARLEGSKGFTKDLCARASIPTAATSNNSSFIWIPSIWIASRSSGARSEAIHSAMRSADSATKRRDTADFERPSPVAAGTSPPG